MNRDGTADGFDRAAQDHEDYVRTLYALGAFWEAGHTDAGIVPADLIKENAVERLTQVAPQGFAVEGVRAPKSDALIGWTIANEDGWREVVAVDRDFETATTMDRYGTEREEDLAAVRRIASPPDVDPIEGERFD